MLQLAMLFIGSSLSEWVSFFEEIRVAVFIGSSLAESLSVSTHIRLPVFTAYRSGNR
jgi:hypothetical protein